MPKIELINICKSFDKGGMIPGLDLVLPPVKEGKSGAGQPKTPGASPRSSFAITDLNLHISDGKTMVVLGPSGCGKTTLLKMIAGLIKPDSGRIRYDGIDMADIPPEQRRIGMIFQSYALYPHFTVKSNILSYFLFRKRTPELDELARKKFEMTSRLMGVDIEYLLDKKPTRLSGGEKQRVALGRCITREPALFLLDEPFSNLDQQLREKYRVNLKTLLEHFKITTVYVTHDQQEALILGDVIAIMNVGRIEQVGTYEDIYNYPKSVFAAEFLNFDIDTPAINLIDGQYLSEEFKGMVVGVRPRDIEVFEAEKENCLKSRLIDVRQIPVKQVTILLLQVGHKEVYVNMPFLKDNLSINDEVWLHFKKFHAFNKDTGVIVRSHLEQ